MRLVHSLALVSVLGGSVYACAANTGDGSLNGPPPADTTTVPGDQDAGPSDSSRKHDAGGGTDSGHTGSPDAGTTGSPDSGTTTPPGSSPMVAGCAIYPGDNAWNRDVSHDPIDTAAMTSIMPNMHGTTALHPDWGDVASTYGIPFTVSNGAPKVPMTWSQSWGNSESDPLACASGGGTFCYPIPMSANIEGGPSAPTNSDRHVLVLDTTGAPNNCTLYELYHAFPGSSGWTADNGAIFHLGSNALRPDGWTSSDAAGLPVMPGLVRWEEVAAGEIKHAIRFTMNNTYNGYIHPATHAAGLSGTQYPPMGMRMRLKASFDTSSFTGPALVIATAMKKYGVILADNGSNWYLSGETNNGWTSTIDGVVSKMGAIHGSDFEIVQSGALSTNGL